MHTSWNLMCTSKQWMWVVNVMNKPTAGVMMICQRSMSPDILLLLLLLLRVSNNFIFDFFICTFSPIDWIWLCYVRDYRRIRKHAGGMRCLFEIGFSVVHGLVHMAADGPPNCEWAIAGLRVAGRAGVCCHFWLNDLSERTRNETTNITRTQTHTNANANNARRERQLETIWCCCVVRYCCPRAHS